MNTNRQQGITVLSLFDGMSCGQIALRELGIKVKTYYASEIDKYAIAQTQLNFPDTVQLGSVTDIRAKDLPKIDLLIGGSPCQGFSIAGKRLNFNDPRSALFFEFVRVLEEGREQNPDVLFLLENVKMKKQYKDAISEVLGLQPVEINSALVSAQNRVRLYWTNIRTRKVGLFEEVYTDIAQPADRGLMLKDILQDDVEQRYYLKEASIKKIILHAERHKAKGNGFKADIRLPDMKSCCQTVGGKDRYNLVMVQRGHGYNKGGIIEDKAPTLTANCWEQNNYVAKRKVIHLNEAKESNNNTQPFYNNCVYNTCGISPAVCSSTLKGNAILLVVGAIRRLTPIETARLQTIPSWYKWQCSETQQYKMLGNGWTVEVIKHIFSYINNKQHGKQDKESRN